MKVVNTQNQEEKVKIGGKEAELLAQIGLSEKEAEIYEIMLGMEKVPASMVLSQTNQKRTTVYSILEELAKKGLVEKDESGAIIRFRARHPYALKEFMESQISNIKTASDKLDAVLPEFINVYQQSQNMPGVKFYEGLEGVKKVLDDSLTSKTEILVVADLEAINKYIKDINDEYVKQRKKKNIKKRILVLDSEYARNYFKTEYGAAEVTDIKFCPLKISPFRTGIQIYDNKISYITMTDSLLTATIVNDPYIYSMQAALFEFIWSKI